MTDTAARIAGLTDDDLQALHARLDLQGVEDAATVEAHHLVTMELLKRGADHGHVEDDWSRAVILVEQAEVDGPDEIEAPEGFAEAFDKALASGGTVSVLLSVDGYVLKADPTVSDVHVDAIMGGGRRRKPIEKMIREEDGKFTVYSEDGSRKFGTYATREEAEQRLSQIERFSKAEWRVGDFATWQSSGGRSQGRITRIVRDGKIDVPDSDFTINGDEDDPAALLQVWQRGPEGWAATEVKVGHRVSALSRWEAMEKADGYDVPSDVQAAARQALKWIADGRAGDGFTSVGRGRARQLADGGSVNRATLVKMRAYFARHAVDKEAEGWGDKSDPTPGMVAWYAWGGDAGRAWANRVLGDVEKRAIPAAITDLHLNLENRQHAIDEYLYGPMNPQEPGDYWERLGDVWGVSAEEAATTRCSNCAAFNVRPEIKAAMAENIGEAGDDVVDAADLGYCELLQFKCAGSRSCSVWLTGGPIDEVEKSVSEEDFLMSLDDAALAWYGDIAMVLDAGGDPDLIMEKAGNPEALRDYWRGGGKGKISWGAGGDFTACVAAVGKYMTSEQAKGYCAIRHREVTGMWPGDKRNRTKKSLDGVDTAPVVPVTGTFTLPGGVQYTLDFAPVEAVVKHPGHPDQKAHAGRGGVDAGVAESIVSRVRDRGGLSVSMVDGSEPPSGFMVARTQGVKPAVIEADEFYDPVAGPRALGSFLKANRDQLTGGDYLGVWHDTDGGKVYLDVSQNVKGRARAERLGAERNQISIWDVVQGKEIATGGTGEIAKADSGDQVAGSVDDDGRGDRRLRGGDLGDADEEFLKHGQHDQSTHGRKGSTPKRSTPKEGKGERGTTIDSYPEATRRAIRRKPAEVQFAGEMIVKGRDSVWDHLVPDGTGGYRLTPERAALHEAIIEKRLKDKPSQDEPVFVMMGGGGGAGKGTLLDSGKLDDLPDAKSRVHIDSDEIKMEIPDYSRLVGEGRKTEVAGWTHEESSIIGKEIQRRAVQNRNHILLDGTGDSSEDSLRRKIAGPREAGYRVRGEYVTAPTLQAWEQNIGRASRGPRGLVPPSSLVEAHKSVSRIVPKMANEFDEFRLWDSTDGRGQQVAIATATRGGNLRVTDRVRYQRFLDKADQPISTDQLLADITPQQWAAIREAR